jgi:Putative beta-barrel porin-2, OmpL-like. bbp2
MKFNKWTLGLAAVGVVSLASAVKAEETANTVLTAASSTTLSGYVDTSAQWNPGTGNANVPGYTFNSPSKADGFNLDAVKVSLEKPLDESEWAAGYRVDLMFGPDANTLNTTSTGNNTSDFAIRQAYVALRTPVGNGIDWKIGVFDTVVGYESIDAVSNPNYTRSWGFTLEPTTHTGILGTYRVVDWLSVAAGVADTTGSIINGRADPPKAESYKTYMGSVSLTAPESWGFLSGSTLYGGVVNGFSGSGSATAANQINLYSGITMATPVTGLRLGLAYDYYGVPTQAGSPNNSVWADSLGAYASFQATEKLSLHARGEYVWQDRADGPLQASTMVELTGTVQYDLWKNVVSRIEVRWDHAADGTKPFGGTATSSTTSTPPSECNAVMIAGNLIYKF